LDFWVYFHNEQLIESFGIATAEAMAAGLVVILPEYMEPTFGHAAVYAAPQEVVSTLHKYWDDADLYEAQSARALSYVRQHLSAAALMERIVWLADEE
jgi:glycosyltransferase involved in cell wall biosynthesis